MLIDDIKAQIDIVSLAKSEGLTLTRQSGRILKALCCFHNEKTPSLTLYPETNSFHCYGCGKTGDPINFYALRHGLSNKEAVKELAQRIGGEKERKFVAIGERIAKKIAPDTKRGKTTPLEEGETPPETILEALRGFCSSLDSESLTYLTSESRGLSEETITRYGIFSVSDYKKAKDFLLKAFTLKALKRAGLLDSKNRFIFIRNKIVIPVVENGRIIALRGRYFHNGVSDPDIIKSPFPYPKYRSTAGVGGKLFNGDSLKTLKEGERVYLCEGEFDTMVLTQHGHNAVGVLGVANYTEDTIKNLNPFDLVIAFDNDERGRAEALKISNIFYRQTGREVIREKLPDGVKDITELYRHKKKNNEKV